jgi:hypothetical protein
MDMTLYLAPEYVQSVRCFWVKNGVLGDSFLSEKPSKSPVQHSSNITANLIEAFRLTSYKKLW